MSNAQEQTFPLDWDEWRKMWREWKAAHAADLRPTSFRFPREANMLADEILGAWSCGGRPVELSEVTFPALGYKGEAVRYVGITIGTGTMTDTPDNPLVRTFAELEIELGIGPYRVVHDIYNGGKWQVQVRTDMGNGEIMFFDAGDPCETREDAEEKMRKFRSEA